MDGQRYCSAALTAIASAVLVSNSALAIYNSWGDTASVAFVLVADALLLLLFLCVRELERAARAGAARSGGRSRIKGAVWALSTLLTAMFASRVAPLMPPVVAAVVWMMAVATAAEGSGLSS